MFKQGIYQVLDAMLGEKTTATEIDYFDIDNLNNYDTVDNGLLELTELGQYIIWKRQKLNKK